MRTFLNICPFLVSLLALFSCGAAGPKVGLTSAGSGSTISGTIAQNGNGGNGGGYGGTHAFLDTFRGATLCTDGTPSDLIQVTYGNGVVIAASLSKVGCATQNPVTAVAPSAVQLASGSDSLVYQGNTYTKVAP